MIPWREHRVGLLAAVVLVSGCIGDTSSASEDGRLRYVALGDSYTIGTSVAVDERWPNQLVAVVPELELVANLGVNGYTTGDLIRDELPELDALRPEFVTLLVGVNDVVQGIPPAQVAGNLDAILDDLARRLPADRIVCVATPDYTRTPAGDRFGDPARQREAISVLNATMADACGRRGIRFVDEIFELSQAAVDDPTLVADDGLHPSGEQYRRWVEVIAPVVRELVGS